MNENRQIVVAGKIEESDFVRSNLWFYSRQWSYRLLSLISFFLIIILCWNAYVGGLRILTQAGYLLVPILVSLLMPLIIWFQAKRRYRELKGFQRNVCYLFGPQGYESQDEKSSGQVSWESLYEVRETKDAFYFLIQRKMFQIVPKRYVALNELAELKEMIKQALGAKAHLEKENAPNI